MNICLYKDGKFTDSDYKTTFGCEWEEEELDSCFLKKAGFTQCADVFGGFIQVYNKIEGDGFYVSIDLEDSSRDFFVFDLIELVNLLKFFGMNFFEEKARKHLHQRIIYATDLVEDFSSYESIVPLFGCEEKVFVTSYEPITSLEERRRTWEYERKEGRKMREKKNQSSAQSTVTT